MRYALSFSSSRGYRGLHPAAQNRSGKCTDTCLEEVEATLPAVYCMNVSSACWKCWAPCRAAEEKVSQQKP